MANRRVLPDTVTIFYDDGEDERYHTTYSSQVHKHVYCKGLADSYQGQRPANPVTIYMFDDGTTNMSALHLLGNGKEYVVPYEATGLSKPPSDAMNIRRVVRRKNGRRRMWHWEVHAE